ncbi:diablo homolog, mitochondrial-like, partial [Anneissia japonica]|uniref:diablo homolog, mitochondrial-like n=1 Tax=Anneissia japonica TaxID=1529436 RepID=UPI0014256E2E
SINDLVELLKLHAECLGDESAEDDLWQMIIQARVEVDDKVKAVQELTGLLNTSRKVLENAAEVAYLAGCEYSAITANEKLHTTHVLVENARLSSQKMESELAQAQQHDIEDVMNLEDSKNKENSKDEEG